MIRVHFPTMFLMLAMLYGAEYIARLLDITRSSNSYLIACLTGIVMWIICVIIETRINRTH